MNKGTLDKTTFEAIEAYVLDRMSATERAAFELRLASEPDLRAELELERENIRAVELGGLQRTLRSIAEQDGRVSAGTGAGNWKQFLAYAAAAALVITIGLLWTTRPSQHERLFAEHFVADPGLPVAMSASNDPVFADAMVSYKEGDHTKARDTWMSLLQQEPLNDTLRYFVASSWLAEGNAAEAIPLLTSLAGSDTSVFSRPARWYLFLAHLRSGNTEQVLAMDLSDDPLHAAQAGRIQQVLRSE